LSLSAKNLTNLEPFTPHYLAVLTLAEEANKGLVWGRVVVALMPIQKKGVLKVTQIHILHTKMGSQWLGVHAVGTS